MRQMPCDASLSFPRTDRQIGGGHVVSGWRTLQQDDLKSDLANYNDGHEEASLIR